MHRVAGSSAVPLLIEPSKANPFVLTIVADHAPVFDREPQIPGIVVGVNAKVLVALDHDHVAQA
jgi:hypothetical protein